MRLVKVSKAVSRLLAVLACAAATSAHSQTTVFDEEVLRAYVSQQVAASGVPLTRFEVQVGSVESRAVLAPCRRAEPFQATGARQLGRGFVGVRCVDGANWSVMLPVTVRAWGIRLVAANALPAGMAIGPQDVREQEIELTRESPNLLRELNQLAGQTLSRAIAPGLPLRSDMFRATLVVQSGDAVRVNVVGKGFTLTAAGQALAGAADGQPLRVRTELGKVLTGIAREGRIVEVAL